MQDTLVEKPLGEKINPVNIARSIIETPLLGKPFQKFRLVIRSAGQNRHTELVGRVFDVTDRFMNPFLIARFKRIVCDEICALHNFTDSTEIFEETLFEQKAKSPTVLKSEDDAASKASKEVAELPPQTDASFATIVKAFKEFHLSGICRVLILDEDYSNEKHIIIQFGRLNALTDYATTPNMIGRSYLKSRDVVYFAMGWGASLPTMRHLPDNIGKGHIHWIIPTDLKEDSQAALDVLKQADIFAKIVPFAHQEIMFKEFKDAKESQIAVLEEAQGKTAKTVKALATELDLYKKLVEKFQQHGKPVDVSNTGSFKQFICYALPTITFMLLGSAGFAAIGAIGGTFLGLLTGGFFASKVR